MIVIIILVTLLVLVASAFFSCSEAALLTITQADTAVLVEQKKRGSHLLEKVQNELNRSIIGIVIMNNIANIVGSIVVGQLVDRYYGNTALAIATSCLTLGVIVFSEIIPKSLGIHYAERISLLVAPIIWLLTLLTLPMILVMEYITNIFKHGERKIGTEEQIRSLVTLGRRAGHIETDEGQLIHRAFILNDKTAKDSMTVLKDIIGLQHDMTLSESLEKVIPSGYSRFPVFGDSIHTIEGFVLKMDILEHLALHDTVQLLDLLREPLVVDANVPADELLMKFRSEHVHLAVVQEDGHTIGIVTLEDVLEELVGNIEDETDMEDSSKTLPNIVLS